MYLLASNFRKCHLSQNRNVFNGGILTCRKKKRREVDAKFFLLMLLPISGVLLETGSISDTMVAKIVMVSIIATPEKSSVTSFRRILFQR